VFGILRAATLGWGSAVVIASIAAGLLLGGLFGWFESRHPAPLLDVRLFTNPTFATGSVSVMVQFAAAFGALFALAQYLQLVLGYSPLKSGLVLWPIAVSLFPLSLVSAHVGRRFGLRPLTCVGLAVVAVGMLLLGRLDAHSHYPELAIAVCVLGGGLGLTAPAATSGILDNVPPDKYGVASAVNDATREIGAALGIALAGSVLSSAYTNSVHASTAMLPPTARGLADGSLAGALAVARRSGAAGRQLADTARAAFTHGMWFGVLALVGIVALGIVTVAAIRKR
ncbi:MAG TPA: MFS transporter, partial [Pseudonocardiaceae bacterium]|nr:MFS transporter [Pseudonocardiaceae bacterium]